MAVQISTPLDWNLGTIHKPKFRVFDEFGADFNVSTATWVLVRQDDDVGVDSDSAVVDNADTDPRSGAQIITIQPTVDLSPTDIDLGLHWLIFTVTFADGQSAILRQLIDVVDYTVAQE